MRRHFDIDEKLVKLTIKIRCFKVTFKNTVHVNYKILITGQVL